MERTYRSQADILEALKGKVSEPLEVVSNKPGFAEQTVRVRLVEEGSGMVGLSDWRDNREWAGIFNHINKVAGGARTLLNLLKLNGHNVDPILGEHTVLVSHNARRQTDEATWYPDEVSDAERKRKLGDTPLSVEHLQNLGFEDELIESVRAHSIGTEIFPFEKATNWNLKLPIFLDYRISQNAMSLEERFRDLQRGVVAGRYTQEYLDSLQEWAKRTQDELFDALRIESYEKLTENPENLRARTRIAVKLGKFSDDEIEKLRGAKSYTDKKSDQEGDLAEIVGISKDEFIERLQLSPEDINEKFLGPERRERYRRRLYINDAEGQIIWMYVNQGIADKMATAAGIDATALQEKDFPVNSWWGSFVREIAERQRLSIYASEKGKSEGIVRAIEFFRGTDLKREETVTAESTEEKTGNTEK